MGNEQTFMRIGGALKPADDAAREWLAHLKVGQPVAMQARLPRNPWFHRKFFALLKLAFDHWEDTALKQIEYKGQPVQRNFERFRKDILILSGFYIPVTNIRGETRLEAESLKFSSMSEERFGEVYSAVINTLLRRVFNGRTCPKWTEQQLRDVVEQILEFDS